MMLNVRVMPLLVTTHHFDIINLGEASDKQVDGDEGGCVGVVFSRWSDPGIIHTRTHHGVKDLLLLLSETASVQVIVSDCTLLKCSPVVNFRFSELLLPHTSLLSKLSAKINFSLTQHDYLNTKLTQSKIVEISLQ